MKKIFTILTVVIFALQLNAGSLPGAEVIEEAITSIKDRFSNFEYQGFTLMVPSDNEIHVTDKEAVVKCTDGTYGLSVKVEKDRGATANAAVEMCRRMVTELDVKNAKISRVIIHGMQGGKLEGVTEGAPITVLILDAGSKYFKLVIINTPNHADWVNITIDSVNKI